MIRFIAVVLVCAYIFSRLQYISTENVSALVDKGPSQLEMLAASVKPGDIVMYTTTDCDYCTQARSWMVQYGFHFSECNILTQPECGKQFKSLGATDVPYLVVLGRHMKNGFNTDELIAMLSLR